jgi:hypothetical protein
MQVIRLGDPLQQFEILVPRGGAVAFRLDLYEPDGSPTSLSGPVEIRVEATNPITGRPAPIPWAGSPSITWSINDVEVPRNTPGAVRTSSVTFSLSADQTVGFPYGPRRASVKYTPRGSGGIYLGRAVVTFQ